MAIDVNISTQFINDTDTPASYVGAGSYKVKVKADETGLEFVADSAGSDTNIMNANLTANADRTQDMNSFSIYFNNGKQFKWLNNIAPTIGQGSFDLQGYGTTVSDILYRIKNGAGASVFNIAGNGSVWSSGKATSSDETAYGYGAGNALTSGFANAFFGSSAGGGVSTGSANTAVGKSALGGNPSFSTAIGSQALASGANYGVAIGANAMLNGTGDYNVVIGLNVGYELSTGSQNTFVGTLSGRAISTGSENIHIGSGLNGALGVTTGSKNTIISANTQGLPSGMTGSVVIGYGASADASNQFSIGSVAQNAGAIATEGFTQALTWAVTINGVKYKIPLQLA